MYWKENPSFWKKLVHQQDFGLLTDFDGTLSPIVKDPNMARMLPEFRPLLLELHHKIKVVGVLSGRPAKDVKDRVGIPGLVYIGNHGIERWQNGSITIPNQAKPYIDVIAAAKREIAPSLLPGMMLEDKFITLSIHYRNAENIEAVRKDFYPFIQALSHNMHIELHEGRKVFELRPPIRVDKGTAFQQVIHDFKVQSAVYLGDDTTDTAAFRAAVEIRNTGVCNAYGVGVHSENTPAAVLKFEDYYVDGVAGVFDFFTFVVNSLNASST